MLLTGLGRVELPTSPYHSSLGTAIHSRPVRYSVHWSEVTGLDSNKTTQDAITQNKA